MWAGNSKGYMWTDDIRKGRGVDEKYGSRVATVLNVLLQNELLTFKTSQSSRKYALNPERREEIYEILRSRSFPTGANKSFSRSEGLESCRVLDVLDEYKKDRP